MAATGSPEVDRPDGSPASQEHTSVVSGRTSTAASAHPRNPRAARSLPPWVATYEATHDGGELAHSRALAHAHAHARPPPPIVPATRKNTYELQRRVSKDGYEDWVDEKLAAGKQSRLPALLRRRVNRPGRRWDHLRTAEPVIVGTGYRPPGSDPYAQWRDFIHSSAYGHAPHERSEVLAADALRELQPGLDRPGHALPPDSLDPKARWASRRAALSLRFWDFMLRHPLVPLVFRLIVLATTIAALAVSVNVFRTERGPRTPGRPSSSSDAAGDRTEAEVSQAIVAIAVDSIAIPYLFAMTWDEYTGKPLGLRPAVEKISLTMLDLVFIIFKSASTALAYEALVFHDPQNVITLHLARSLAGLMLVGLISWVGNFTISVFRLVERLGGVEDSVTLHHHH